MHRLRARPNWRLGSVEREIRREKRLAEEKEVQRLAKEARNLEQRDKKPQEVNTKFETMFSESLFRDTRRRSLTLLDVALLFYCLCMIFRH